MAVAPRIEVRSRPELRGWLAARHATAGTHWLVTWRKPSPDHLAYAKIVEELLCWGWIDSLPRALDERQTMLRIARRSVKSAWSAVNKAHVARARANGVMAAGGRGGGGGNCGERDVGLSERGRGRGGPPGSGGGFGGDRRCGWGGVSEVR